MSALSSLRRCKCRQISIRLHRSRMHFDFIRSSLLRQDCQTVAVFLPWLHRSIQCPSHEKWPGAGGPDYTCVKPAFLSSVFGANVALNDAFPVNIAQLLILIPYQAESLHVVVIGALKCDHQVFGSQQLVSTKHTLACR